MTVCQICQSPASTTLGAPDGQTQHYCELCGAKEYAALVARDARYPPEVQAQAARAMRDALEVLDALGVTQGSQYGLTLCELIEYAHGEDGVQVWDGRRCVLNWGRTLECYKPGVWEAILAGCAEGKATPLIDLQGEAPEDAIHRLREGRLTLDLDEALLRIGQAEEGDAV